MHSPKLHLPLLLLASVLLLSGCVTHYSYPDASEQIDITLRHLYVESRTLAVTNGVGRYVLVPDTRVVDAVETILLHYSQQSDVKQRRIAGSYLAKYGTDRAFARALAMAQADPDPRTRAELWEAIAELKASLHRPERVTEMIASNTTHSVLTTPVLTTWYMDDTLPAPGVTTDAIESAIISQYRTDDGFWEQTFIDRIPFVPFSGRQYVEQITVRQRIARSLQYGDCSKALIDAFRTFSLDPDPAISEFAKHMVTEWDREKVTPCSPIRVP